MQDRDARWEQELRHWFEPFSRAFRNKPQRRWAPVYVRGLLMPGQRKSVEPMADRVCSGETQQLHHFVSAASWATEPLEEVLAQQADALVGGDDAHLIIDDTALVKKGEHSVGVAHQYCGELGKQANCQVLVSVTLCRDEVPVPVALRLHLPESWSRDPVRRARAGVPPEIPHRPKWKMALEEIERLIAAGVRFGDVLADAGYGSVAEFRRGLEDMKLTYAVGVQSHQKVYVPSVRLRGEKTQTGRSLKWPLVSTKPRAVRDAIAAQGEGAFWRVTWRIGTKGPLAAEFAVMRVRVADGPVNSHHQHLPGVEQWLVAERRSNGVMKYYFTNHTADASHEVLASAIKARWACEQAHEQMKQELGLDHFEGRSWRGLRHHAVLTMIAFAFLQHLRLRENKAAA
jgi:SRSO17 transposase